MNRVEFIDTLRMLLEEELPKDKVNENVNYYNEYIMSAGNEQQQMMEIDRIGNPYLIAQTVIESYRMSSQYKYSDTSQQNYYDEQPVEDNNTSASKNKMNQRGSSIVDTVKNVCITVGVIVILFFLFRFAFTVFIRIGLPLLAGYLLIKLISGFLHK